MMLRFIDLGGYHLTEKQSLAYKAVKYAVTIANKHNSDYTFSAKTGKTSAASSFFRKDNGLTWAARTYLPTIQMEKKWFYSPSSRKDFNFSIGFDGKQYLIDIWVSNHSSTNHDNVNVVYTVLALIDAEGHVSIVKG